MNPASKLRSLAESQPDSLALVSSSVKMTYRDLSENVARFSGALRKAGISKGSVVAVELAPELEAVVILALAHLGAASLTGSQVILSTYGNAIDFLVTQEHSRLSNNLSRVVIDAQFMQGLGAISKHLEPEPITQNQLVRLVFSSGTTGTPKGVPLTAGLLPVRTASAMQNWRRNPNGFSLLGLDTITGTIALFWAIEYGQTFYVASNPAANLKLIVDHAIEVLETSPARLRDLVEAAEDQEIKLKQVLVGGSLMAESLTTKCRRVFEVEPEYVYGSSELGSAAIGAFEPEEPNCVGLVVPDAIVEIVDDFGQNVDSETVGHIRYRKNRQPDDYWLIESDPRSGFHDGWFYPGDLGALSPGGTLRLAGRSDDMVNVSGNKFNLLTLDTWLTKTGLFDEVASFTFTTEGETRVGLAFVSTNPPKPEVTIDRVRRLLPTLQISEYLRLDELPRNLVDKIDRRALSALIEGQHA